MSRSSVETIECEPAAKPSARSEGGQRGLHAVQPVRRMSARIEPFDSYWQAPDDVEAGYAKFAAYYRVNVVPHMPAVRDKRILVVSCGAGYLLNELRDQGYHNVSGIDSDPEKVAFGQKRGLACEVATAFEYLEAAAPASFDAIVLEQEINHLTMDESIEFLALCRTRLKPGGLLWTYGLNGANPLVGSENIAHNIDHFYLLADYSYKQLLELAGFAPEQIRVHPLELYVFKGNPLNYVGLAVTRLFELACKTGFILYGKKVSVLSKKISATARLPLD